MARPTGVTIIAVLYFILAAFCVLGGVLMFVGGGFLASMINQQGGAGGSAGAGIMAGLGAVAGVVVLIFGAIAALVGWGLLKLKSWARIVALIFAGLGLLGALLMLLHFSPLILFGFLIRLVINGLILWYLLKPEVAAAFQN